MRLGLACSGWLTRSSLWQAQPEISESRPSESPPDRRLPSVAPSARSREGKQERAATAPMVRRRPASWRREVHRDAGGRGCPPRHCSEREWDRGRKEGEQCQGRHARWRPCPRRFGSAPKAGFGPLISPPEAGRLIGLSMGNGWILDVAQAGWNHGRTEESCKGRELVSYQVCRMASSAIHELRLLEASCRRLHMSSSPRTSL